MLSVDKTPAGQLRASLALLEKKAPFFLTSTISPILTALEIYVGSIDTRMQNAETQIRALEARLRALDKMPSSSSLNLLTRSVGL